MEDILDVYSQPFDDRRPVICMDEKPYQLTDESRVAIPMCPFHPERRDAEYVRKGTCSIFVFAEPLAGWRHFAIREHRTRVDWANQIKELLEVYYPQATKVCLVMDNLNTHAISSLYEAFDPETAFRLAKRLEIHYTPKHGSWMNVAEIELSAMTRGCLGKRFPDISHLSMALSAWESVRNANHRSVDWQFKTTDARIKLKRLYPHF